MNIQKPILPKGMRDTPSEALQARRYILDILTKYFQLYGFAPLETPAMEQLTTLMGKYGQEGDRLLFKVLNSGNFLSKLSKDALEETPLHAYAEKGLRYDLTIPLARYVAQNRHALTFPFKRSQIQPVWRADRPQRGRYREFYQCDIDTIGSNSIFTEAEMLILVHQIMVELQLTDYVLLLNHRGIFTALSELLGTPKQEKALCRILDKTDKMEHEEIIALLEKEGFSSSFCKAIEWIFHMPKTVEEQFKVLKRHLGESPSAQTALREISQIIEYTQHFKLSGLNIMLTPRLARGMDYYTGAIFELIIPKSNLGSLGGGGRYNDLTAIFGLPDVAGVGFSFGLERIYDLMQKRGLLPSHIQHATELIILPLEESFMPLAVECLKEAREKKISAELFLPGKSLQKALGYAEKRNISWAALLGSEEVQNHKVTLKNMKTRKQERLPLHGFLLHLEKK